MTATNEDKEIVLDTKMVHFGYLHKLVQHGGSFKFQNFPFGVRFSGNGGAFVEMSLFALPVGTAYTGHANPSAPKKPKVEKPKKVINVEEEETIEM